MNKSAIVAWIDALKSGTYPEVLFGPMRSPAGFNKIGVFVDCWRLSTGSTAQWSPEGEILGHRFMPPQEALRWLYLRCHPFECPRHGRGPWEEQNDPIIEHCATCEANNFFQDVLVPNDSFAVTASKLQKWSERL